MNREIDLLLEATSRQAVVVEKATNVAWTVQELRTARRQGQYYQEDTLVPMEKESDISGPFPGCLQGEAAPEEFENFHCVGQTRHFILFVPPEVDPTTWHV